MALYGVYTKLKTIARDGGEAYIYKVRHNELGYVRALRVLKEPVESEQDPIFLKFKEECKKLLRLGNGNHPNIVHIYQPSFWKEPNNDEGKAFVEMDYVDGMDLLKYVRQQRGVVPVDDVLRMVEQMSSALAFCHVEIYKFSMTKEEQDMAKNEDAIKKLIRDYRVVHNDIHSNNIMRRENGDYVLLDFGLSFDGVEFVRTSRRKAGVQEFMAPEKWDVRVEDEDLTPQLDIYGFGVVMYEYLTGKVPFKFDGTTETQQLTLMNKIKASADSREVVPSIFECRKSSYEAIHPGEDYKKDYPQWLEEVIYKCLQKDPEKRYPDGKALYDDVMGYLKDENPLMIELKGLREQVETLKKSVDHLTSKLDKAEVDKEELREKAEEEKAQLRKEADDKIEQLRKERDSFEKKLKEAESIIIKLEEKIKELEKRDPIPSPPFNSEIAKLKEQLKQANERIHELEQQLAEKKLPTEEELKHPRNRFLKAAALVLAILLGAGGWFGWNGYKKINYTEQQLENKNDSLIRQERRIRRLQNDNEKQKKNLFLRSFHPKGEENSLVEGDYIGSVTNKNGSLIFLTEQIKGGVYHVMAYSFNEDSNRYEKTMAFNVPDPDRKGKKKDADHIPSVSCECWKSSSPNGDFFVFNKADNTLYLPLMHENAKTKQNFGSDRYIVYEYDGNRFTTKSKNEGGFWIHSSLRDYKALVAVLTAKNRLIRIDEMKDGSYRCAIWIDKVDMSGAPDLVLTGSLVETSQYLFEDDIYSYQIDMDSKTLKVAKNGKQKLFGSFDIEHIEVVCKDN